MIRLGEIVRRLGREGLLVDATRAEARLESLVAGIASDSRLLRVGSLFCAVRGTAADGHAYLAAAAASGAIAALVEQPDSTAQIPQIVVRDGRLGAAFAAAEFYREPWRDLTLIGVTGTNGKTTTAAILRHLLSRRGPAASIGTLGAVGPDGAVVPGSEGLTTPGPIEFAVWVRRFADAGVEAVAIEVSSHALHQRRVDAGRFDAVLFTNLSRDHLDYHGTFEEYRNAKLRLTELVDANGAVVVNADDPAWQDVQASRARLVRYGIEQQADVRAEQISVGDEGVEWTLRTPDGSALVHLPLFGMFNVANALGAAATLWSLGWSTGQVAEELRGIPQVRGRLERVEMGPGQPTVLIDFAHTPDALERALTTLRPMVKGRLVVVFGAGGDRDQGKRGEMGRVAAAHADLAIVTSDNPRTEDPERIAEEIESGMGHAPRLRVLDRREAIHRAIADASPEDLVLLAGKGHETYQIWGEEKRPFDERLVVRELFAGLEADT